MADVVGGAALFQAAIVVGDAAAAAVVVAVVERLAELVERVQRHALGEAPLHTEGAGVVGVVAVVGVVLNGAELRVGLVVLRRGEDLVQHSGVGGDVQRDGVDVPVVQQADALGALIVDLGEPGFGELHLEAAGPHHHIRHAHVGVEPGDVASAVVGALEGDGAIGGSGEGDATGALREKERVARVARGGLHVGGGDVFFEVLADAVGHQVDGVHAEAGTEDDARVEIPGQTEARLEVVQIALGQVAAAVEDGAFTSGERVVGVGVELRLLAVLGGEWRFVAPTHAQLNGQVAARAPRGLPVESLRPPLGKPGGIVLLEDALANGAEQEAGERVAGVGREGRFGSRHAVLARGQRARERVVADAHHFVAELHGVFAGHFGEVVLEGVVGRNVEGLASRSKSEEGAAAGVLELREGFIGDARDAEFLGPAGVEAFRDGAVDTAVEAQAHFVDGGGAEGVGVGDGDVVLVERLDVDVAVDGFGEFADGALRTAMTDARVAAEDAVIGAELVVQFGVEALEDVGAAGVVGEVVDGAGGLDGAGVGGIAPGLQGEDVFGDRVEEGSGDLVIRERIASPGGAVLARGEGVVNRKPAAAEAEIAGVHFGAGNGDDHRFGQDFTMFLEAAEEERLVLDDLARRGAAPLLIAEGAGGGHRFQEVAMPCSDVDVAVFKVAVKLVGAALEDDAQLAAGGVAELGGCAGGPHLKFLNGVEGRDHGALIVAHLPDGRFLAANAVHGVADGPLALADGVLAVDIGHAGHIEQHAMHELLHNRQLLDDVAIEHLARPGCLRFQKRSRGVHLYRVGNVADFEDHINARGFVDTKYQPALHKFLEALCFGDYLVVTG